MLDKITTICIEALTNYNLKSAFNVILVNMQHHTAYLTRNLGGTPHAAVISYITYMYSHMTRTMQSALF
jgi:hypothetical protein